MDILFLVNHIFLIFCCILTIEVFIKVRFIALLNSVLTISKKVFQIISSSKISDHWKEKMVLTYACVIIKNSLLILAILLSIILIFLSFSLLSNQFITFILSIMGIVESIAITLIYIKLRKLIFK